MTISGSGFDWHEMDKLFDAVIMGDCSQCPIHAQLKGVFHASAMIQSDIVRKHGATPMFTMTWAYKDKPEMTQHLADAYTTAGNDNDALVIPADACPNPWRAGAAQSSGSPSRFVAAAHFPANTAVGSE